MPSRINRWLASRFGQSTLVVAIVAIGAALRAPGFSGGQPWFDDAWVVLPARQPFSTAFHMVDTTPLFTLSMRSWIRLNPSQLWWAQSPAFVFGLAAIVAVYFALKYFKLWWPLPALGAFAIAVSPVVVTYSTRIKQYNLDILFACALLVLAEAWRRQPSRRLTAAVAVVAALALLTSASTIVIVAPVCLVILHAGIVERPRRSFAATIIAVAGITFVVEYLIWLRHLSHGLTVGWTNRGYMLTFANLRKFAFALENMGSEFFHWMLAVPSGHPPDPSKQITAMGVIISLTAAVLLAFAVVPVLWRAIKERRTVAGPLVVPAVTVALAVCLALVKVSPFGGGRTDEVIYPAVLLIFGAVITRWSQRDISWLPRALAGGVAVAVVLLGVVATRYQAAYPTTQLATVAEQVTARATPNQFIVVDPWMTFTWADGQYTKTSVSFQHTLFDWSQGFHVVSDDPKVIISANYFFPQWYWRYLSNFKHQLWYVAMTASPSWPTPSSADQLVTTRNYNLLVSLGWTPTTTTIRADHVEAVLMVFKGTTPPPLR